MVFRSSFRNKRHGYLPIREDDCSYVWKIPAEERCDWVISMEDCVSDSVIQYTKILFCDFGTENTIFFVCGVIAMVAWLLYLFLMLGSTSDNFFCPSLAVIADILKLSDSIAGVTILAFGNGAPDIFTSLASVGGESIIMFTELIGAGVFVTSIIAGSVAVCRPFRVHLGPFIRDACFYTLAIAWISIVVEDERVYLWEAVSFILIYFLFIGVVVIMQIYDRREESIKSRIPNVSDPDVLRTYLANRDALSVPRIPLRTRPFGLRTKIEVAIAAERGDRGEQIESDEPDSLERPRELIRQFFYDVSPIDGEEWIDSSCLIRFALIVRAPFMLILQLFVPVVNGTVVNRGWSKLLNCLQLCVTPMFVLLLVNAWRTTLGGMPTPLVSFLSGAMIAVIVFLTTRADRVPKYHNVYAFLGFVVTMLTVYLIAGEVMAVLRCIGFACNISDAMLGITFLAWGNSVGDLISNIAISRRGYPRMGYAACFGGPMFNTLLGLGLTYGIAAVNNPDNAAKIRISDMAPGCEAFLLCTLTSSLIYLNITGGLARRSYGYMLYTIYFVFILLQLLSEFHIIHPLGTDHRSNEDDERG